MTSTVGRIGWIDLAVSDATAIRDFYKSVVGWASSEVPMGDYSDYCVHPTEDSEPVAGICHARGTNAAVVTGQWMIYITVANLDESLAKCEQQGGKVVLPAKSVGGSARYAIIQDPAGAVVALYDSGTSDTSPNA